jgi:ubiquinone/menaquinone biosynthesis C-methylase UbiE
MPRYKKIYESQASAYDALVSKEDYLGNLLPAIQRICSVAGKEVVEFGAGTGRLTKLLAPQARFIRAFDAYPAMLQTAKTVLDQQGIHNVSLEQAENKNLPVLNGWADLSVAGWTFGHCTSWFSDSWKVEIAAAVGEMLRVTKKENGTLIILETLGTGHESPIPPNAAQAEYYDFLEKEFGFSRSWIRTDYRFDSLPEAKHLTSSFFGREFEFLLSSGLPILPECTGIWSRRR